MKLLTSVLISIATSQQVCPDGFRKFEYGASKSCFKNDGLGRIDQAASRCTSGSYLPLPTSIKKHADMIAILDEFNAKVQYTNENGKTFTLYAAALDTNRWIQSGNCKPSRPELFGQQCKSRSHLPAAIGNKGWTTFGNQPDASGAHLQLWGLEGGFDDVAEWYEVWAICQADFVVPTTRAPPPPTTRAPAPPTTRTTRTNAVPDDSERPAACNDLADGYINCWQPHSDVGIYYAATAANSTVDTSQVGECGFHFKGDSMTNATCTGFSSSIDGFTFNWGNGAFVAKGDNDGAVVGLDFSGEVNIIGKWDVQFDESVAFFVGLNNYVDAVKEANENNSTQPEPFKWDEPADDCGFTKGANQPASINNPDGFRAPTCTPSDPNGYYSDPAIMITNQHAGDPNNNYAIANYGGEGDTLVVSFNAPCNDVGFSLHDENQGNLIVNNAETTCDVTVDILKSNSQLLYIQGTLDNGAVVDFFDPLLTVIVA